MMSQAEFIIVNQNIEVYSRLVHFQALDSRIVTWVGSKHQGRGMKNKSREGSTRHGIGGNGPLIYGAGCPSLVIRSESKL